MESWKTLANPFRICDSSLHTPPVAALPPLTPSFSRQSALFTLSREGPSPQPLSFHNDLDRSGYEFQFGTPERLIPPTLHLTPLESILTQNGGRGVGSLIARPLWSRALCLCRNTILFLDLCSLCLPAAEG